MTCQTSTGFPLSCQQEQAWRRLLKQGLRRATCRVDLYGAVDPARLRNAVRCVVERYEILRTTIACHPKSGVWSQQIQESSFLWEHEDLRRMGPSLQARWLQRWLNEQVDGRDPASTRPLRVLLAACEADSSVLLLSLPAFNADAASMERLVGLIASAYCGQVPNAKDIFQYGDFALWQQQIFAQPDTGAGQEFWKAYCRKLQPANWGRAWPAIFGGESGIETSSIELENSLADRLHEFSSRYEVPCSTVLLACWHLLLTRISQLQTQLISIECDGRSYPEFENALGSYAKRIPLQVAILPEATFAGSIVSIERTVEEVRGWQQSFLGLPENAQTPLSPAPEVGFDYLEFAGELQSGDVKFVPVQVNACAEDFVLRLSASRQQERLRLHFYFDAARLSGQIVEEWGECYVTLLAAALEDPQQGIGQLPILSESQRQRMLVDWNQTAADYPRDRCMQELIEEQVARTPGRIAVRCMDRALTYEELNREANQLARWLRGHGVGPGRRVGLCIDRSLEMVVGLLGLLKAGGAYVPLNPEHPPLRLAQQLEGAVALVTEERSLAPTSGFPGAVICLDRDRDELRSLPAANLPLQTNSENPVYVLFTSGSTGVPKGVAARHRNLVNYTWFARGMLELERYPEGLRFALVSTICADVGITCIYPALTSGGCLHVIPYDVATDSARYGEYARREQIDILKIVPSHLAALLEADGGRAVLPRKFIVAGGERLTRELMEKITAEGVGCEVINHYAPTETTCGSLTLRLSSFDWKNWQGSSIPLGRPVANTRLYVLDAAGEPAPVGVTGELYIAGDGVSAGYAGDPQRTAERFLPDPFVPGATMYRSGDVVRYLPDGNIEFLERADDQVKIRGFRVELGEVQAALQAHPAVKQAVVLAREGEYGKRLLGWIVPGEGASVNGEELREHLKRRLPEYMVPAKIAVLTRLPLTRNGKIDRQGLPEPEAMAVNAAPRTAMEESVAAIWREVLEREQIGVEENFFEIGGHSLLATQIIARLRNRLALAVPVRMLFEHPTIAGFAAALGQAQQEELGLAPPPIRRVSRNGPLPLSFAQEGLWVRDQFEPRSPLYNIPRAWRLKGSLNPQALQRSLNEIVRRHESQRTTFAMRDGRPVQIIVNIAHIPLATYDLASLPLEEREEAARQIIEDESLRPFDLERGPLVRAHLVRLAEADHVLLLVSHHIISDAWSAAVFFRELSALYGAFSSGAENPLPELELQYADHAVHERDWLKGAVLEKYVSYWRKELAGAPPLLALPTDHPRSHARSFRGSYERARMSPDIARAVRKLAQAEAATPFTILISGFQTLLWSYSGQPQIVVGTDVANRNTPEVEALLGFFVNVLPIRTDFSGDQSFRDLIRNVRQRLFGAYAHQQLPFAKIVQDLQPERNNSYSPVVQALFVFQNTPRTEKALAGLQVEAFPVPVAFSKFDLAVFMAEERDGLAGYWVYSTDLFEQTTILDMSRRFEVLLEKLVAEPDERIGSVAAFDNPKHTQAARLNRHNVAVTTENTTAGVATLTAMEEAIAAIWREVLEREQVGVEDNLFEIGGHSLIATQIAARLRSQFGVAFYVRTIFDHPTVRGLARAIEAGGNTPADIADAEIQQAPRVAVSR